MFVCVFECVFLRVFEFVRNRVQEGPQNSLYPSIKLLNILHKKMQERQPSFTGVHCARVCCMCMISFKSLQQETAYIFMCCTTHTHTYTPTNRTLLSGRRSDDEICGIVDTEIAVRQCCHWRPLPRYTCIQRHALIWPTLPRPLRAPKWFLFRNNWSQRHAFYY